MSLKLIEIGLKFMQKYSSNSKIIHKLAVNSYIYKYKCSLRESFIHIRRI